MNILCFGLSHRTAPIELLERMSFSGDRLNLFLKQLVASGAVTEACGLSTCNRTEFYMAARELTPAVAALLHLLVEQCGVDLRGEPGKAFLYENDGAVRHLFKVACGVDSMVVGENEILGQLRKSREGAFEAGLLGASLDPLLLRALDVGRRARQETAISKGNVSVASVAATVAVRQLGTLVGRKAVVLGAGETAETAARQLQARGLTDLVVANRTYERARELAHLVGGREAAFAEVEATLADVDVVVCAIGAPHYVVSEAMIRRAMSGRTDRPMVVLDVSVPRNVEPLAGTVPDVALFGVDDLKLISDENRAQRETQVQEVKALVEREAEAFRRAIISQDMTDFVSALHRRVENVRQSHLTRYGRNFDAAHQEHLEAFTSGLTRSLFHELVLNLRSLDMETDDGRRRFQVVQEMFGLAPDDGGD